MSNDPVPNWDPEWGATLDPATPAQTAAVLGKLMRGVAIRPATTVSAAAVSHRATGAAEVIGNLFLQPPASNLRTPASSLQPPVSSLQSPVSSLISCAAPRFFLAARARSVLSLKCGSYRARTQPLTLDTASGLPVMISVPKTVAGLKGALQFQEVGQRGRSSSRKPDRRVNHE
jgi:hypothetical protein